MKKFILTCIVLLLAQMSLAQAQEYRVYTKVFQNQENREVIVSRSLTLFRSGKAYDHIDSLGEVIIFDPSNQEFVILNMKRDLMTTVKFDQLKQQLKIARKTTEDYAEQLANSPGEDKKIQANNLMFQLNPQFQVEADSHKNLLKLSSPGLNYYVKGTKLEPSYVTSYLKYADWMCRLNYVMHPGPFLPDCRITLNRELGQNSMIPLEVELQANLQPELKLRAEHRIKNELGKQDLRQIYAWETALKKESTRKVTFHEYQRTMIVSQLDQ